MIRKFVKEAYDAYKDDYLQEYGKPLAYDYCFVFRDGVSDGEMAACREFEVQQLMDGFEDARAGAPAPSTTAASSSSTSSTSSAISPMPKICYCVIQKVGLTKLFAKSQDTIGNPPPGLVVFDATTTTSPEFRKVSKNTEWKEFYLVSTHNTQSTTKPLHCFVLYDTLGWKPTSTTLQQLCFNLCHLYPNFCGTTRVPCVTRAAHRVAELISKLQQGGGQRLVIHPSVKTTMCFL